MDQYLSLLSIAWRLSFDWNHKWVLSLVSTTILHRTSYDIVVGSATHRNCDDGVIRENDYRSVFWLLAPYIFINVISSLIDVWHLNHLARAFLPFRSFASSYYHSRAASSHMSPETSLLYCLSVRVAPFT